MMLGLLCLPIAAGAQTGTGTIAGVVRDSSGAVIPGVTVEAASPALIEKIRTVVTDAQGLYRIVDLRPGAYTVTFTLPGFNTVKREGIELTTAFTATVNVDLRVGSLEETVTVSGAAPIVDTQNVIQQTTLARATLDALPTPKRTGSYAQLLLGATAPAVSQDVGGLTGERGAQFSIHGQRPGDLQINQDGSDVTLFASVTYTFNPHNTAEIVLDVGGSSAESMTGGVRMNIVPKDGGNLFSGSFNANFSRPDLQNANLTDSLRARGLRSTPSVSELRDVGGAVGGPIKKDKLWFFGAYRNWVASRYVPGNFSNKLHGISVGTDPVYRVTFYEPDPSRPANQRTYYEDRSVRLTWQATSKDKIATQFGIQDDCNCPTDDMASQSPVPAPEATGLHYYQPNWMSQTTWSRPASSRLLLEGGVSGQAAAINGKRQPETGLNDLQIIELSTNMRYGSRAVTSFNDGGYGTNSSRKQFTERFAMSYVTGSHAFKSGVSVTQYSEHHRNANNINQINGARYYTFRNRVPVSVTIFATPRGLVTETLRTGIFAQDQWTVRKLTLNAGVRYDGFNGSVPEQHLSAGLFVPARDMPAVKDAPNWKNINPRLGVAYNVFGTGRTAVKAYLNRYAIGTLGNSNVAVNNPIANQAFTATRTWTDANGNYVPDCVLGPEVLGANGECGALSDRTFGQVKAGNTAYADEVRTGFQAQPANWQGSVSIQHELRSGLGINASYFRTWYKNLTVTDNLAATKEDFSSYCITAPVDKQLPGGGGNQICGLYDVNPAKFGLVNNLVSLASDQTEVFNGLDLSMNARLGGGKLVSGGVSFGRTETDNCYQNGDGSLLALGTVTTYPRTEAFCHVTTPWSAGTQVKFLVVYPLPWDLQTSATYQNLPGIPVAATYVATNAQIAPSLGRNLAAGAAATVTVDLIPPGTQYEDRIQQVDFRLSRAFRVRTVKVEGIMDIHNTLNASSILVTNTRYGTSAWLDARSILAGRLFKFGVQVGF